jgi:hypothetical protein
VGPFDAVDRSDAFAPDLAGRADEGRGAPSSWLIALTCLDARRSHETPFRSAMESAYSTLECQNCGAALAIASGQRTASCVYCTSPSVIERPPGSDRPAPTFVIGFVVTPERAVSIARRFIRRPLFAPEAFRRAQPEEIRGLYLPVYIYSGAAFARYAANIGEHYRVRQGFGKNSRTVTKTEWRPLSGQFATYVHDRVVTASRGIPNAELEAIEPFDLRVLHRYTPTVISGWAAEEPSLAQAESLELARREAIDTVGRMLGAFMPGDSYRDLQYETWLEQEHLALTLLPIWVLAFRYAADKPPVRLLVNGQTGAVFGRAPRSTLKIVLLVLAIVALIAAIVLGPVALGLIAGNM